MHLLYLFSGKGMRNCFLQCEATSAEIVELRILVAKIARSILGLLLPGLILWLVFLLTSVKECCRFSFLVLLIRVLLYLQFYFGSKCTLMYYMGRNILIGLPCKEIEVTVKDSLKSMEWFPLGSVSGSRG